MISAKFLWGNVLLGGKLQIGAKNSNFEIFESALYMKSVSMPLRGDFKTHPLFNPRFRPFLGCCHKNRPDPDGTAS